MLRVTRCLVAAAALAATMLSWPAPASAQSTLIRQAASDCRDVAFTYDSEFSSTTQQLADTLDSLGIRTTWFFLGEQVERYAPLVRQIAARHQIGNHSFTHPTLSNKTPEQIRQELNLTEEALLSATGTSPQPLFRPPYGSWSRTLLEVAEAEGYPYTVLWSVDPRDWDGPSAAEIRQHVNEHAFPGAIVLFHGRPASTVEATRLLVGDLRGRGYQFVTLTELLGTDRHLRDFGGDTYTVQPGDAWPQVAACHNLSAPRLQAYTGLADLTAGAVLTMPYRDEAIITVNGRRLAFPVRPRIDLQAGRALAHVRLAESLGATVEWDGTRVHVTKGELHIEITPGQQTALVGGAPADMLTAARIENDRLLLPVRFLAEQLGAAVAWDSETWTVSVSTPAP
ncbi:MAG TPA: polysaccharide deacetylase family protein [Symbiobacteriaceae bacterium]|nr:polysaccharide deacetylase family protein [Symbiobacteriaceae bacterium]